MSRVTYGPEGTQIINVDGKFYLGVDTGDSLYMYEVPKGWTLADLTDMTDIEQNNQDASASFYNDLVTTGDMIEITEDQFLGSFLQAALNRLELNCFFLMYILFPPHVFVINEL